MQSRLHLEIQTQPDDTTCGPTCLQSVYRYWGDEVAMAQLLAEVRRLDNGGTLGVYLGQHALRRGYRARIYTLNLQVFDPTWFAGGVDLIAKLRQRRAARSDPKLAAACAAYIEFLELGGEVRFRDLTPALIRYYLDRQLPILTGLSATYLYHEPREDDATNRPDDVAGDPSGHFVVLCGYDRRRRTVLVADPLEDNPLAADHKYEVGIERVLSAILLGVLTYDGNLMVVFPKEDRCAK